MTKKSQANGIVATLTLPIVREFTLDESANGGVLGVLEGQNGVGVILVDLHWTGRKRGTRGKKGNPLPFTEGAKIGRFVAWGGQGRTVGMTAGESVEGGDRRIIAEVQHWAPREEVEEKEAPAIERRSLGTLLKR